MDTRSKIDQLIQKSQRQSCTDHGLTPYPLTGVEWHQSRILADEIIQECIRVAELDHDTATRILKYFECCNPTTL